MPALAALAILALMCSPSEPAVQRAGDRVRRNSRTHARVADGRSQAFDPCEVGATGGQVRSRSLSSGPNRKRRDGSDCRRLHERAWVQSCAPIESPAHFGRRRWRRTTGLDLGEAQAGTVGPLSRPLAP